MRDLSGVAALAVALLWIAYLVPHRLRHRQLLLESRAGDRFSGALRVLAVTDRRGRALRAGEARAECGPGTEKRSGLLTPGRGIPVLAHGRVAVRGGTIVDRPHGMQDKITADAARRAAQRRAQRAASLARRAAAARRRGLLTVVLLTVSAVAWVVVGLTSVALLAGIAPTVTLVGVLVLGRRAVVHGRAADDAWERQRHTSVGASRGPGVGDPSAPVTGRAYHPSDERTEVIARIRDDAPARSTRRGVQEAGVTQAVAPEAGARGNGTDAVAGPASIAGASAGSGGDTSAASDAAGTDAAGWSPVPVPRPVYTTKASAPRREPIPLVLDEPAADASTSAAPPEELPKVDDGPAGLEAAANTPNPTLDLDAILARRRTAG